jgi:hypothetical protein
MNALEVRAHPPGNVADGSHVLAEQLRETMRLGTDAGSVGSARPHARFLRRVAVALLAFGCVLPLLAPSRSSAFRLLVRREAPTGSLRPNNVRHDHLPPRPTAAAPRRPDASPPAEGGSLPILLILALNSVAMLARLVSSPPSWIKN